MNQKNDDVSAVDEIVRFNADRKREYVERKYDLMAAEPFSFFRGTDHLFAARWPQFAPANAGPAVLLCGDLHIENFGAYRTDDGDYRYDINDFDEALVAPASFDLVRATTSVLLAAELWKFPPIEAAGVALDFLTAYRTAINESARSGTIGEVAPGRSDEAVRKLLGATATADQVGLLDQHTEQSHKGARRIVRDDKHPEVTEKKIALVSAAIEAHGCTTATPEAYRVLDVTGRVMGIGSLGVRRYTVLIAGGGTSDTNRLLDVKEARPSSVLSCTNAPQPPAANDAERVVEAQRRLPSKPTAGLAALEIGQHYFRVRELIPEENRSKLDRLKKQPAELRAAVALAGTLTAWSQLRGCSAEGVKADRWALAAWAKGEALDAVQPAATRAAELTTRDYQEFKQAHDDGTLKKRSAVA